MARKARDARFSGNSVPLPSEQEMAIRRNYEARTNPGIARRIASGRGGYAMSAENAIEAASLMDRERVISPFAGLPVAAQTAQFRDSSDFFGQSSDGEDGLWDEYYDDDQSGYGYNNLAGKKVTVNGQTYVRPGTARDSGKGREPALISVIPTSTTNPERPRTVAAGYDEDRQVLTVVFRDGTFYNYYQVRPDEWDEFKAQWSKGQYILSVLDYKPRGTARMASASMAGREGLYRIARTGQWMGGGLHNNQVDRSTPPPRLNPTKSRRRK